MLHKINISGENFVQIDTKSGKTKKVKKYYRNNVTGELLSYSEARKECSVNNDFDDDTNILSYDEKMEIFNNSYQAIFMD